MSDDFNARYRLLKCVLVDDGLRTHNAQEVATGRVVMVHIIDSAGPDEVDALRIQLAELGSSSKNSVLETATLPSGFVIVTEFLPGAISFRAWLKAHGTSGGATPLPGNSSQVRPAVVEPPVAAQVTDERLAIPVPVSSEDETPGSFTELFGVVTAPAVAAAFEPPPPGHIPPATTPRPAPAPTPIPTPSPFPAPAAAAFQATPPPPARVDPPAAPPPGEFTQMFRPSALPPTTPVPAPLPAPPTPGFAAQSTPPAFVPQSPGFASTPPAFAPQSPPPRAPEAGSVPASVPEVSFQPLPPPQPAAPKQFEFQTSPPPQPAAPKHFEFQTPSTPLPMAGPGEFTQMFAAGPTAAPLPAVPTPSPISPDLPQSWSPLGGGALPSESPIVPRRIQVTPKPPEPIRPAQSFGNFGIPGPADRGGDAPVRSSPLSDAAKPGSPVSGGMPAMLPPPMFRDGNSTPLSSLGGAAPSVNSSAGPSDFTRLIQGGPAPVVPSAPAPVKAGKAAEAPPKRTIPVGLIVVINAVILATVLLITSLFRRQTNKIQDLKLPAPKLPASAPAAAPSKPPAAPGSTTPPPNGGQ